MSMRLPHPPGHFYSPIVDPKLIGNRRAQIWPPAPVIHGIDFDDACHVRILTEVFPRHIAAYDYPEHGLPDEDRNVAFYTQNSQFSWLDSRALFVLMREWNPRRIIEVGSGYSSMLMTDVNRRFLEGRCEITSIEPYPRPFLRRESMGISRLVDQCVQDVPLATFDALEAGDVLFIDSSHVAKTGSDVNHLYFKVVPHLKPGVRIHIHDIFLPHEYPYDWVVTENRSWNEQYLVQALLMDSTALRVVFGCSYAFQRFPDEVKAALALPSGHAFAGGSLWIERI